MNQLNFSIIFPLKCYGLQNSTPINWQWVKESLKKFYSRHRVLIQQEVFWGNRSKKIRLYNSSSCGMLYVLEQHNNFAKERGMNESCSSLRNVCIWANLWISPIINCSEIDDLSQCDVVIYLLCYEHGIIMHSLEIPSKFGYIRVAT